MEWIFEQMMSVEVPTIFFSNVHSDKLANYAGQLFTESPCMESILSKGSIDQVLWDSEVETEYEAFVILYAAAVSRYHCLDENSRSDIERLLLRHCRQGCSGRQITCAALRVCLGHF